MIFEESIIQRLLADPEYAAHASRVQPAIVLARQNPFHAAWMELHTQLQPTAEWFSDWCRRLPRLGCECDTWLGDYLLSNPPSFKPDNWPDWPGWTWTLHNDVNAKPELDKPRFSWMDFIAKWRPDLWPRQSPIADMIAVTSLSPLPSHQAVQEACLESWRRFGLHVVSVNLPSEIASVSSLYDVEFVTTEEHSLGFNRKTPTINSLLDVGIDRDTPIVLINSDCALYGPQECIKDVPVMAFGIRQNWTSVISDAVPEAWGIDLFVVRPSQAMTVPRLPFGIGQPMWDYWLAWHLQQMEKPIEWIGERLIYHKSHANHWQPEESQFGRDVFRSHYGINVNWGQWREQQPYAYSRI